MVESSFSGRPLGVCPVPLDGLTETFFKRYFGLETQPTVTVFGVNSPVWDSGRLGGIKMEFSVRVFAFPKDYFGAFSDRG